MTEQSSCAADTPPPRRGSLLLATVTGVAVGAVIGFMLHGRTSTEKVAAVAGSRLGLTGEGAKAAMNGTEFAPALAGITTLAAVGGLGGLFGSLADTVTGEREKRGY